MTVRRAALAAAWLLTLPVAPLVVGAQQARVYRVGVIHQGGPYSAGYHTIGRLSASLVQRVLQGAAPGDLPIEAIDRLFFTVNLKTARTIGLTIPASVLSRADELIE